MSNNFREDDHPRNPKGEFQDKPGANNSSGVSLDSQLSPEDQQVRDVISDCVCEGNSTLSQIKDAMEDATDERVEWSEAEEALDNYLNTEITCCQDCSLVLTNDDDDAGEAVGDDVTEFSAQHEGGLSMVGTVEGANGSCDCCGREVSERSSEPFLTVFESN